jgi:CHAT domain-containing protein
VSRTGWIATAVAAFVALAGTAGGAAAQEQPRPAMDEAFEAAQWASLSSAGKALQQLGLREASGSPELAALVRQRQDLVGEATRREAQIASGGQDAGTTVRLRGEIDSLRAEIAQIDARLAAEFPRYAELATPKPATIADIQRELRDDEALLFFLSTDAATFVWAIDAERGLWFRAALWGEYLGEEIATLRADLDPHARSRGADTLVEGMDQPRVASFDRMTAYFLYTQLIKPAEDILDGKNHVFVVADGPLGGLPLSVIVSERPEGKDTDPQALRDTAWLAKRFAVTTLPTVASLPVVRRDAGGDEGPRRPFLGFGAPLLGVAVADEAPVPAPGSDFFRGALADVSAVRALPSLPQTGPELRRLAATLGADDTSLYLGKDATEVTVKGLELSSVGIVAFATHGLLSGELTGLAEPALVLTPPDAASVDDDGLLTASEISTLKLSADWVILSACNTAGGDGRPDAEGLSGLARAFLYAGARSILVSHWPVRDDAAARLTTEAIAAFNHDNGIGRSEALRQAMLRLMDDETDPSLAHPSAWAPFVVVGEGGA